jgi:hypothetical protein
MDQKLAPFVAALRAAHAEAVAGLAPGAAPRLTLFEDAADLLRARGSPDESWPISGGLLSVVHGGMALPKRARFAEVILSACRLALRGQGGSGMVAEALHAYADDGDGWLVEPLLPCLCWRNSLRQGRSSRRSRRLAGSVIPMPRRCSRR